MLDTSAFRNALDRLQEMHAYARKVPEDETQKLIVRTALMKGYEFSYAMATKSMQRVVEEAGFRNEEGTELTFREVLRGAFERGLIRAVEPWLLYREKRNKTSHAYADQIAEDVIGVIPAFLKDADFLLEKIEEKTKVTP